MNQYKGDIGKTKKDHVRGHTSQVAKLAFEDIRNDPTMKVSLPDQDGIIREKTHNLIRRKSYNK